MSSADSKKEILKSIRQRKYLNKSFDAFRSDLLEYARTYYPDRIQDFSDSSLGGLFLDFAAFVGDSNSFYLDHQFSELDPETAVETANIERALRSAGVEIVGAAPSIVTVTFFIEVPSEYVDGSYQPREDCLPVIQEDTVVTAENGTQFFLTEKVDFTKKRNGKLIDAKIVVGTTTTAGIVTSYIIAKKGVCISGRRAQENFTIGAEFIPFRKITLSNTNVTEIISVTDTLGNTYYKVDNLTQDVIYKGVTSKNADNEIVKDNLEIVPAPYRFVSSVDISTRSTTLTFGGGSADSLNDDVIPDPSEFAISLYGKKTFSRPVLNPNSLLSTRTLGVISSNTTISIEYRYGGGLSHNVPAGSIKTVSLLRMSFPGAPSAALASSIRAKTEATNEKPAAGGEDPPTIDDLKLQISAIRNAQSRIVTREDLLARVYTLPSNFGRVFRAGVRSNPHNPLATQLFIICRDSDSKLTIASDTLKKNLALYLNQFRMISDAIDVLDAGIINLSVSFEIVSDPTFNKTVLIQSIIAKMKKYFDIKNFQIDQPIIIGDIMNIIFNTVGVISINNNADGLKFVSVTGNVLNRNYPGEVFDVKSNTVRGMIIPPPGRMFELRYLDFDIEGTAI